MLLVLNFAAVSQSCHYCLLFHFHLLALSLRWFPFCKGFFHCTLKFSHYGQLLSFFLIAASTMSPTARADFTSWLTSPLSGFFAKKLSNTIFWSWSPLVAFFYDFSVCFAQSLPEVHLGANVLLPSQLFSAPVDLMFIVEVHQLNNNCNFFTCSFQWMTSFHTIRTHLVMKFFSGWQWKCPWVTCWIMG